MADLFFFLFIALQIVLCIRAPSFTHMLRTGILEFLTVAPLFYVFSRTPKSLEDVRVLSAAFVLPILVLCAISIPEFIRSWHFYYSMVTSWFDAIPFGYSLREGYLRATTSVFNPIVWGYAVMCAIGVGLAALNDNVTKIWRFAAFGLLVIGLVLSLSRGPWIGAIGMVGVYILMSRRAMMRIIQSGVITVGLGLVSLLTPFGKNVIGLLPVIGDSAGETISYRQDLLEASWRVILQNPLFGSVDFLASSDLQHMRQGQGIIDIVNTYLQVGLASGLVGLGLFLAYFTCVALSLWKALRVARMSNPLLANYCRAYLATLIGILATIFTTSSEGQIPHLYWIISAMGLALARLAAQPGEDQKLESAAPAGDTPQRGFDWK